MAEGAIMMGIEILNPRTVVVMSILDTSISIRGRNRILEKASLFSWSVHSSSAPDA
uniref:Uncharacterized protein n=1 Tax=Arundo donax TaxID=35708 RepID=A0A0A9E4A7_ARUDO